MYSVSFNGFMLFWALWLIHTFKLNGATDPCNQGWQWIGKENSKCFLFSLIICFFMLPSPTFREIATYTSETPEPAPFLIWHGTQMGVYWCFLWSELQWFVRCICQMHILLSERKDKHILKCCAERKDHGRKFVLGFFFAFVASKKPK